MRAIQAHCKAENALFFLDEFMRWYKQRKQPCLNKIFDGNAAECYNIPKIKKRIDVSAFAGILLFCRLVQELLGLVVARKL